MIRHTSILAAAFTLSLAAFAGCNGGGGDGPGDDDSEPMAAAPQVQDDLHDLGQALFFDRILSGNLDTSCASCHHPGLGTDDDLPLSKGVGASGLGEGRTGGTVIARNAPALFNLHLYPTMFWDSRVSMDDEGRLQTPAGDQLTPAMRGTLRHGVVAAQAMFPVTSPEEMRGADNDLAAFANDDFTGIWSALMERLGDVPEYVEMFERAYPGESFSNMTFAHAANAIAAYELRAFEVRDSAYQRFLQGDEGALTRQEQDGMRDFFRSGCGRCHRGPLLSDFRHHNTGLAQFGPGAGHGPGGVDDYGREAVTGDPRDRYEFRTTPLTNLSRTGPYGHAGQFATLHDFVDHYRNARNNLQNYDIRQHVSDSTLWSTQVDNVDAIGDSLDRDVRNIGRFNTDDVVAFLQAANARGTIDLSHTVPTRVPSGLPVE